MYFTWARDKLLVFHRQNLRGFQSNLCNSVTDRGPMGSENVSVHTSGTSASGGHASPGGGLPSALARKKKSFN